MHTVVTIITFFLHHHQNIFCFLINIVHLVFFHSVKYSSYLILQLGELSFKL
jgi:hypothetical protein